MERMDLATTSKEPEPDHGGAAEALPGCELSDDEIRQRARAISRARNGSSSDCAWDWYQAEYELRGRRLLGLT